jgi:putative nucleotidyltransferase with HDIG domain
MAIELLVNLLINCNHQYGEGITTLSHSFQAASVAKRAGAKNSVVMAALFHDIGHMFMMDDTHGFGAANHASASARVLRRFGFPKSVYETVAEHANAKRYLVAIDPEYRNRLSSASRTTLRAQGGPMTAAECREFEQKPNFHDIIALRRFDDAAKQKFADPTRQEVLRLVSRSKL